MPASEAATRRASKAYSSHGERLSPQHTSSHHHSGNHRESKRFSVLSAASSPRSSSPASPLQQQQPSRILFYHSHDPYYGFTNFSNHPVVYNGKKYPTSEHLFQSFKFHEHRPELAEHIRTCSERPSVAFSEARRFQPEVRRDWKEVNIAMMDIVVQLKFEQHDDLRTELLGTGNASLFEDSDKDAFWGVGADWTGRNELGKALERLRTKLRSASRNSLIQPAGVLHNPAIPTPNTQYVNHGTLTIPPAHHSQPRSVSSQSIQFPSPTHVQSPTQARILTHPGQTFDHNAQFASHDPPHLPIDSSMEIQVSALAIAEREMCRHPDCVKPVYHDGKVKSEYCSQQHRQEAVSSGFVEACIKCLKMPQSESDFFCGRGCREESLSKPRVLVKERKHGV